VTRGRAARGARCTGPVVLAAVLLLSACDRPVAGEATPGPAPALPDRPAELEPLLVDTVPSGLPRLPDERVRPPAGSKSLDDVAGYADDPAHERRVLEDYGYRFGWERFWGVEGGAMTGVFVHRLSTRAMAAAYSSDLAQNDAAYYDGVLTQDPSELPGGCRLLTVADPAPGTSLDGPAAISWCVAGPFSVSVTAVADSLDAALAEVRALTPEQLERLRPHGG
jgi:hypothetical protein